MTTVIDGFAFDFRDGAIGTPQLSVRPFTNPGTAHVGAQVLSLRGDPFEILLRRYTDSVALTQLQREIRANIGRIVQIVADGTIYVSAPYQIRFLVIDVMITDARVVPYVRTHRGGVTYTYSPAAAVESKWRMQAIPAY